MLKKHIAMAVSLLLGVLLMAMVAATDLSPGTSAHMAALEAQLGKMQGMNAAMQTTNDELKRRLTSLRTNKVLLERVVREDLGFIRDGEIVVVLDK